MMMLLSPDIPNHCKNSRGSFALQVGADPAAHSRCQQRCRSVTLVHSCLAHDYRCGVTMTGTFTCYYFSSRVCCIIHSDSLTCARSWVQVSSLHLPLWWDKFSSSLRLCSIWSPPSLPLSWISMQLNVPVLTSIGSGFMSYWLLQSPLVFQCCNA